MKKSVGIKMANCADKVSTKQCVLKSLALSVHVEFISFSNTISEHCAADYERMDR